MFSFVNHRDNTVYCASQPKWAQYSVRVNKY